MNGLRSMLAGVIGTAVCLAAVGVHATGSSPVYRDLELLGQSLSIVSDAYVDAVDVRMLVDHALRSMVESLDQHSTYLDVQELEVVRQESEGRFGGIGLAVASRNGFITVVAPLEGSPAAEAGIRPADIILEINGESTQGMLLRRAVSLLRGPADTQVELSVVRKGTSNEFALSIRRKVITIPSVPYAFALSGPNGARAGYVRVASFTSSAVSQFRDAVRRVLDEGCTALVIDLRANPGGLLEQAIGVCDILLPEGLPICSTLGAKGARRMEYVSSEPGLAVDLPVVALIDEGSASGAEIVGAALQDSRRGVLVGRSTFGKGTVQEIRELGDGTAVKITTARWFTPRGYCVDRELSTTDTLRVSPSVPHQVGLLPNLLVEDAVSPFPPVELAAAIPAEWIDSLALAVHPPVADPSLLRVGDELLEGIARRLAAESPLAASDPDSASALSAALVEGSSSVRAFLGGELARRWWGDVGAARHGAAGDTLVQSALAILADPARYNALLDSIAPARIDTLNTVGLE